MEVRPMEPAEIKYSYSQSPQITGQTGMIGHIRADMGKEGDCFFSTWSSADPSYNTEQFKAEVNEVIDAFRHGKDYGQPLKSRSSLAKYCRTSAVCSFGNQMDYGIRVDTDQHSYLMRLNPNPGYYNLYCYCYVRHWLDLHIRRAERGIRFVNGDYREQFRIRDGDCVRITVGDETRERTCRYVDDYHFELDGNVFHIFEFREKLETIGGTVIPLRSSLPQKCYSVLESTGELILLERGKQGYTLAGVKGENMPPRESADHLNEAMGVTKAQEAAMSAGSMFGWDTPAADPKHYDENGKAVRPRNHERRESR